jgi:hypothetical protein
MSMIKKMEKARNEAKAAHWTVGVGGATNAEYVPNHIVSTRTTLHKIYHDAKRPSHMLLPVIQQSYWAIESELSDLGERKSNARHCERSEHRHSLSKTGVNVLMAPRNDGFYP